jgi:hypothetical protein
MELVSHKWLKPALVRRDVHSWHVPAEYYARRLYAKAPVSQVWARVKGGL